MGLKPGEPPGPEGRVLRFSREDLKFLVEQAAPGSPKRERLMALVQEDPDFRRSFLADERVVRQVVSATDAVARISPVLYFEVLLRRALKDLELAGHTLERAGRETVPVFDTRAVVGLLHAPGVLEYLAEMLASFTRVESHVTRVRVRRGVWRRVRFSDMDIDSLMGLCATAEEEQRLALYKRIADVCLFLLGMFPEHLQQRAGAHGGQWAGTRRARRSAREYEEEGRRFYRLAGEHPSSGGLGLAGVFWLLHERFSVAARPISFLAHHYLAASKGRLFGAGGQGLA